MTPTAPTAPHIPVMLDEVIAALSLCDGAVYADGTFGAGGYTKAILESADCMVIAIDRDKTALERATLLQETYADRLLPVHGCFGDVAVLVHETEQGLLDGFVIDIGVSSMQLDEAERGFSFRHDGPLDMRMDAGGGFETAADIVNTYPEEQLANVIYEYGDERYSRRVARAIVKARSEKPIERTLELADIVRRALPKSSKDKKDPATKTFQALRIAVNDEMGELRRALLGAEKALKPGGRLVVVSFHSLEDGIVKKFLFERAGYVSAASRHLPEIPQAPNQPTFTLSSRKAAFPTDEEISLNPRSRSARLRVAVRTDAPSWEAV